MVAQLALVNPGPPLTGWRVTWRFRGDERVTSAWGAEISQSGRAVVARNAPYNARLATGNSMSFGFQADHRSTPRRPADFRLNGTRCGWA